LIYRSQLWLNVDNSIGFNRNLSLKIVIDSAASGDHFDSLFSFVARKLSKRQAIENGA
jgi:hypothetical protein